MVIGIILMIVFALLIIGGIALICWGFDNERKVVGILGITGTVIFSIAFILIPFSFRTIQTGEIAVVKHLGKATRVREAGTYFDFWITESYEKYDAKVQQIPIQTAAYSSDSQPMEIELYVQYQIQIDKALDISRNYGGLTMLENRIQTISNEKMKSVLSQYKAEDIIKNRALISPKVEEAIKQAITTDYYVNISTVVLTNIDFSDAFEKSVEDKMIAEQQKLQADYENQKALAKAENDLLVAKQKAEARIEASRGDAEAQKLIAQAEAYSTQIKIIELARSMGYEIKETTIDGRTSYNIIWGEGEESIKNKELLLNYIKYLEYLSIWDGKLPEVISGDNGIMIEIPNNNNNE